MNCKCAVQSGIACSPIGTHALFCWNTHHKLFVLEELYDDLTLSNEESEKDYPYNQFENSELWSIVKDCLNDLIDNQDIEITTKEEYVVGYLCKMIAERK